MCTIYTASATKDGYVSLELIVCAVQAQTKVSEELALEDAK